MGDEAEGAVVGGGGGGGFTVVSWNVNGLRGMDMGHVLGEQLAPLHPNILALQETKMSRSQLREEQALIKGYSSYYSFDKIMKGHSGVATYVKNDMAPIRAEEGICSVNLSDEFKASADAIGHYGPLGDLDPGHDNDDFPNALLADNSGRTIITQHRVVEPDGALRLLHIINVYCPRLRNEPGDFINNKDFKLLFHRNLIKRAETMVEAGHFVIILGDLNVSHKFEDQSCIENSKEFVHDEFREWFSDVLLKPIISEAEQSILTFKDTFRIKNPRKKEAFTCWNTKINARPNNYGSRIDYILADSALSKYLETAEIHPEITGSDHCPISAKFHSIKLAKNTLLPPFATKYYKEFAGGKQQNLLDMFKNMENRDALQRASTSQSVAAHTASGSVVTRSAKRVKQTRMTNFINKRPMRESSPESYDSPFYPKKTLLDLPASPHSHWMGASGPKTVYCSGHNLNCALRTVIKNGINKGRQFYACPLGAGKKGDANTQCNFFQWASSSGKS